MIIDTLFLYLIFSSAVFVYGIGLKRVIVFSNKPKNVLFQMFRMVITICISVFVCRGITLLFLVPARLQELFPFVCILFTYIFSLLTEKLFEYIFHIETKEISITICSVLIAVNEGLDMIHSIIIGTSCCLSFFLVLPILYAIRSRLHYSQQQIDFKQGALIFLSIAIIMLVLFSLNVSWFNLGVA
ncbi:MAG: hypothetical protein KBT02_02585 [Treponema sp.]|nr:hypothetical protein [Candidatus Treponema caballi]